MAAHIEGPLYYERMGRVGPVMAFVHPNPMDQSCWIFQVAHVTTRYRCIAIDIPGYGRSPKATPGLTMGASETERSQRSPSQNDTNIAGWRRVSCWSHRGALAPSSPARRRIFAGEDRHQQTIDVGRQPPPIATHIAAQAAGAGRAPRRSISYACRCPRARPPLSERCHKSPPHRIVETGWLSRATP